MTHSGKHQARRRSPVLRRRFWLPALVWTVVVVAAGYRLATQDDPLPEGAAPGAAPSSTVVPPRSKAPTFCAAVTSQPVPPRDPGGPEQLATSIDAWLDRLEQADLPAGMPARATALDAYVEQTCR